MIRQNLFSTTDITRDTQVEKIIAELQASGAGKFDPASLVRIIVDLMGASTEFLHYALERKIKENFRYTASHYGSVVQNAKNIGYDLRRPTPANGIMGFMITNPIIANGVSKIIMPAQLRMKISGVDVIKHTRFEYTLTEADTQYLINETPNGGVLYVVWDDVQGLKNKPNTRVVEAKNIVDVNGLNVYNETQFMYLQGVMRDFIVDSRSVNIQVGQIFQRYLLPDETFSNYYGEGSGLNQYTTVTINDVPYEISRETFMEYASELGVDFGTNLKKICIIESSTTTGVEIYFGDGKYVERGAISDTDVIKVKYLSTLGVSGRVSRCDSLPLKIVDSWKYNYTTTAGNVVGFYNEFVKPFAVGPLSGGGDIEDIDSIRYNSGKIFKSLNRLTDKDDYESFMRSYTEAFNVKYASAWSEHDEIRRLRESGISVVSVPALANVVLVSVVGELYDEVTINGTKTTTTITSYDPVVLDNLSSYANGNEQYLYGQLAYLSNTTMKWASLIDPNDTASILTGIIAQQHLAHGGNIDIKNLINKLDSRCEITNRNVYVQPQIIPMTIKVRVVVDRMVDFSDGGAFDSKLTSDLYAWCRNTINFDNNFYKSKIIEIVESFYGVLKVDVEFKSSNILGADISSALKITTTDGSSTLANSIALRVLIEKIFKQTIPQQIYGSELIPITDPQYSPSATYWDKMYNTFGMRVVIECLSYLQNTSTPDIKEMLDYATEKGIKEFIESYSDDGFDTCMITQGDMIDPAAIDIFISGIKLLSTLDIERDGRYFDAYGNIEGIKIQTESQFASQMVLLHPSVDIEYIYK